MHAIRPDSSLKLTHRPASKSTLMTNEASTISLATSSQLISYGQVGDHGLEGHNPGAHVKNFVLRLARQQQPEYAIRPLGHKFGLLFVVDVTKGTRVPVTTVRLRGMGTGFSEASKRVPIFSFATQGGKKASEFLFWTGTGSKPERLRSDSLQADLSLIV